MLLLRLSWHQAGLQLLVKDAPFSANPLEGRDALGENVDAVLFANLIDGGNAADMKGDVVLERIKTVFAADIKSNTNCLMSPDKGVHPSGIRE
jgi:hypothetical protein